MKQENPNWKFTVPSTVPKNLHKVFSNQNLIPIVGAGVSMSIKNPSGQRLFPSWSELLERAADTLDGESKENAAQGIRSMIKLGRFKNAAEIARTGLTGRLWTDFFNATFSVKKEAIALDSLSLPQAIWKLSNRVITLNYDKVMRFAAREPESLIELDNMSRGEIAAFGENLGKEPAIWHLHGRLDNLSQIIFTTEAYDGLYLRSNPDYAAALRAFHNLCATKTFIFIGCSLDDAELLSQISLNHALFQQNTGPHYALVPKNDLQAIQQKLKDLPIELVPFEDFGRSLVDLITEITEGPSNVSVLPKSVGRTAPSVNKRGSAPKPDTTKIAVFSAQPIEKKYDYTAYLREIRKLKAEISYFYLNVKSINEVGVYDYIFILTKVIKGKIVIEDEAMSSRRIGIRELEDSIGCPPSNAVFLFLDHTGPAQIAPEEIKALALPMVIFPRLDKNALEKFNFKVFRRGDLNFAENTLQVNCDRLTPRELSGEYSEIRPRTRLPASVDPKTTKNFIGRANDLETICRKIVDLGNDKEILTVKGSGGIGKTITVKKAVVALAERNFFPDGIDFIDCEFTANFEVFEQNIARIFDLEKATDVRNQIKENIGPRDALIILDNVETLLYLDDTPLIKSFISFISDFATVVVTSRELLTLECEQHFELRQFTNQEAYELFFSEIPESEVDANLREFIKTEIIEKLLDNNPLAIKLITKNIPEGKSYYDLKCELENDIFRKVSESDLETFDSLPDSNIQGKKSLYASINYSYRNLDEKEKTAFEILSLFPDGINMEDLKRISSENRSRGIRKNNNNTNQVVLITDSVIKSLENKSIVQVNNSMIKLQSIVGKFAERQFKARRPDEIERYFANAFEYNFSVAQALVDLSSNDNYRARLIFSQQQSNFVKSVEYANCKIDAFRFLNYLEKLHLLFISISTSNTLLQAIEKRSDLFFERPADQLCFEVLILSAQYYNGDFAGSFFRLQECVPIEIISSCDSEDESVRMYCGVACDIYCMEGHAVSALKNDVRMGNDCFGYPHALVHIGELNFDLLMLSKINFFTLEAMLAMDLLTIDIADSYIKTIYEKGHLEITQSFYVRAKLSPISDATIRKLVVVNPYTAGLKSLMFAFNEKDSNRKSELFKAALNHLTHIKYYYVEALLLYATFLKDHAETSDFMKIFSHGISIARDLEYRYLLYRFENLIETKTLPYSANNYPMYDPIDFAKYFIKKRGHTGVKNQAMLANGLRYKNKPNTFVV